VAVTLVLSVRKFKNRFPEFKETDATQVQRALEDSQDTVDATVWGSRREQGIAYQAAHLLAMAPLGEQAKLKLESRGTIYGQRFAMLQRIVAGTPRVI
jgi:hypothetical protein